MFGVQSSARRTRVGAGPPSRGPGRGRRRRGRRGGDAAAGGRSRRRGGRRRRATAAAQPATSDEDEERREGGAGAAAAGGHGRAVPLRDEDRRPRVPGTASNRAGLLPTPVRTGSGSAGLWPLATLSAPLRSPEADMRVVAGVYTAPRARSVGPPGERRRREPRTTTSARTSSLLGLVVALVAQSLVDAPGHVALALEDRASRPTGTIGSAEPWRTYVGTGIAARPGEDAPAPGPAPRTPRRPSGPWTCPQHSGSAPAARLDGRVAREAARREPVRDPQLGQDAGQEPAPGTSSSPAGSSSRPGAREHQERRAAAGPARRARSRRPRARPASGRRARAGAPGAGLAQRPRGGSRGRRGGSTSAPRSTRGPPEPPLPRWS